MDHFAQGLSILAIVDKVKKHPLLFCPLFTDNDPKLLITGPLKDSFRELLLVEYTENGSGKFGATGVDRLHGLFWMTVHV